jgi:signal transduction histidine kinase
MKKPVIICIDDESIILESLKIELTRATDHSCLVETAEGGQDALDLLAELQLDDEDIALVISDYLMPDIRGDELLRQIHQLYPNTLKIMLTGQADVEAVGNAIRYAQLYRYIAKPWRPDDLRLTVREALHSYLQSKKLAWQHAQLQKMNRDLEQLNSSLEQKVTRRTLALQQEIEERKRAEAMAVHANQAKSIFLANMSHELRTPLNVILGLSQVMARNPQLDGEQQENLRLILQSGEHLLTLINNVLDLSKIEAGKITLNANIFDLHRLLDDVNHMFAVKAASKGLTLLFERAPHTPQYISTDEVKLRQVLINLLNNAVKFTAQGRIVVRVGPHLASPPLPADNPRRLYFEIEDTGPGLAPDEMEAIFEPFVQSKIGRQSHEGTGLGLPISRKFVRLMGGDLTAAGTQGRGSVFGFTIEVMPAAPDARQSSRTVRRAIGLAPGQPRYRILVVDDKPDNRYLLIKMLAPLGFTVQEAAGGPEAIAIWESWEPHLIWMDIRMPGMDGYETTRRIKAAAKGRATVIIALTASVLDEERAATLAAGCDDFANKPFREHHILELISRHLGAQFIYQDESLAAVLENAQTDQPGSRSTKDLEAHLAAMPPDWLTALHQAAIDLDPDAMLALVDPLCVSHPSLAEALTRLINNFQFDELLHLTGFSSQNENI